jgi:hypothetical protein
LIPYILQPPRKLWHQVLHCSSHQSIWSPDQILVQPACWHLSNISMRISSSEPSHSPVGMQSMVLTEIANNESWSLPLPRSKYPENSPHINISSQEGKNNKQSRSSQKTILWHTLCRCRESIAARLLSFIGKEAVQDPYPLLSTKLMLTTTCCNNSRKPGRQYTTNNDTIVKCLVLGTIWTCPWSNYWPESRIHDRLEKKSTTTTTRIIGNWSFIAYLNQPICAQVKRSDKARLVGSKRSKNQGLCQAQDGALRENKTKTLHLGRFSWLLARCTAYNKAKHLITAIGLVVFMHRGMNHHWAHNQ